MTMEFVVNIEDFTETISEVAYHLIVLVNELKI